MLNVNLPATKKNIRGRGRGIRQPLERMKWKHRFHFHSFSFLSTPLFLLSNCEWLNVAAHPWKLQSEMNCGQMHVSCGSGVPPVCPWCFQQCYFKGQHCSLCMSCVWWVKHHRVLVAVAMRCKSTRNCFQDQPTKHTHPPARKRTASRHWPKTEVWLQNGI